MKNIKFSMLIVVQLFAFQVLMGQVVQTDENGRLPGASPAEVTQVNEEVQSPVDDLNQIDDADNPGDYYLRSGNGEDVFIGGVKGQSTLVERLDDLEAELEELRRDNEQLVHENKNMKMEMSSCCAEVASNLNLSGSYLLQNSPNPFQTDTNIQYFIADSDKDVKLEIRNVNGSLLDTFDLDHSGNGELRIDGKAYANGSYVYTLSVDGKIIDSKVMILK